MTRKRVLLSLDSTSLTKAKESIPDEASNFRIHAEQVIRDE